MNIFYAAALEDDLLILDEQESRHCVKVLRTRIGEKVNAVDGKGGFYEAELVDDDHRKCKLSVLSRSEDFHPLPYDLHIGIAPTKSIDRFEWFLEKATEIGVSSITPLLCERSERKVLRLDRLEKVIISAMKQSMKAYKPVLNQPAALKDWLTQNDAETRLIAHCDEASKDNLWQMKLSGSIKLAIGPEGDFSRSEIDLAAANGFSAVSLSTYRLRTETAGIIACSAVYFNMNQ